MKKTLEKPQAPLDEECCESGVCNPCVWDRYYAKLKKWRLQQVEIKEAQEKPTE